MVILLEPSQNAAMRRADPYDSRDTVWYHALWGTHGTPIATEAGPARHRRVRPAAGSGFCDPALRDQPLRRAATAGKAAVIAQSIRPALACAICDVCARRRLAVRCMSIGSNHVHALMKLDADPRLAQATVADCKRIAALAACVARPERFWAGGCELLKVRSELHFDRVSRWICNDRDQGHHVWKHPRLVRLEEEPRYTRTGRADD